MASPFQDNEQQPAAQEQQRQPQPGSQPDKVENRGGFDCEFVERPPEHLLQSECPVCLHIIRDPYQVTCCGYSFCRSCIERIKADNKPCPTCNVKGFSEYPNKGLKRSLYALQVRCSHQKDGCEWTGELDRLDVHLNKDPPPKKQLDGCQFGEIDCLYCEEKKQRQYIQVHQDEHCVKRPFSCEYCHDYESNFDDVIHNHWPVCGFHPVRCPNECGWFPQRQNLDSHVADECPLTSLSCDFVHVGCGVKLPCKDMPEHLRENLLTHTSLLAVSHAKLMDKNHSLTAKNDSLQESHTTLSVSHAGLQADCNELKIENQSLKTRVTENQAKLQAENVARFDKLQADCNQLKTKNQTLKEENTKLKQELTVLSQEMKTKMSVEAVPRTSIPLGPPVLTMTGFKQHKKDGDHWCSPPVYTHHHGYKLCLSVFANGQGPAEGTHVSVYVHFMKGDFNDSLKWPFRGVISFRLLDQLKGVDHKTLSLIYDDTVEDKRCTRGAAEGEITIAGWGYFKAIAHNILKPEYLRNDTLLFQIHKVELKS